MIRDRRYLEEYGGFTVGDKVKLPTKKRGEVLSDVSTSYSVVIETAKRYNQDYLYIIKIFENEKRHNNITFVLDTEKYSDTGDYFYIEDLEKYESENTFKESIKIGDKVVPHAKTVILFDDFDHSTEWRKAKEIGQPYLYVTEKLDDRLLLSHNKGDCSGDYYSYNDITLYEELVDELAVEDNTVVLPKDVADFLDNHSEYDSLALLLQYDYKDDNPLLNYVYDGLSKTTGNFNIDHLINLANAIKYGYIANESSTKDTVIEQKMSELKSLSLKLDNIEKIANLSSEIAELVKRR